VVGCRVRGAKLRNGNGSADSVKLRRITAQPSLFCRQFRLNRFEWVAQPDAIEPDDSEWNKAFLQKWNSVAPGEPCVVNT
jgi:hypothetical protein